MIENQPPKHQLTHEKYGIYCPECKKFIPEKYTLKCPHHANLIESKYRTDVFVDPTKPGIWKFSNWLPILSEGKIDAGPVTYKSEGLAKELGLKNLYISFNGYWPERKANVQSCTFKEYEALVTYQRLTDYGFKGVYLASAGNTARAFAQVSQKVGIPAIIFLPEQNVHNFWTTQDNFEDIKLITLDGESDYTDAIQLASKFSTQENYAPEGGARNVARRDGMSTVIYDHVYNTNKLPDHYFQGVGSGTGAIAAWEAAKRFLTRSKYGNKLPILHLGQNFPYDPLVKAWNSQIREFDVNQFIPDAKSKIKTLVATMLSNRTPPYSVPGGLFDALTDTKGKMYSVTNAEIYAASKLFEEMEEIDIVPEGGVAVASLIQSIAQKQVNATDMILVNITGGGFNRLKEDYTINQISCDFRYKNESDVLEICEFFD